MPGSSMGWARGDRAGLAVFMSIALAASGCREQAPVERAPTIAIDSAGVEVVTSDPRNSDIYCTLSEEPVFSVGTLEGADPYMFFFLRGAARLLDGSVAVMDNGSGEIRIFGPDGRHLRSMGGKGEGPGEFRIGRFIWVLPGDTLWVGDYRPWRYHVYASTGAFSRTVAMEPPHLNASLGGGVLANGVSVNVRDLFQIPEENFRIPEPLFVEAHAADGAVIGELAKLDGRRWGEWDGTAGSLWMLFDPVPVAFARGTTIAITTAMEPEVRLLDEEMRLRRIVRWLDPDREVTRAHVQAYRDNLIERRGGRGSENWGRFDDDMISDRRPVADVFPTVSSLRVGRDGRLWVYPYRRPGEEADWWIFGQDGDFQCRLDHPAGVTIYEVGADYLLGVHRDELDVERVVMYELRPPVDPGGAVGG